jgi:hypothetical protein
MHPDGRSYDEAVRQESPLSRLSCVFVVVRFRSWSFSTNSHRRLLALIFILVLPFILLVPPHLRKSWSIRCSANVKA